MDLIMPIAATFLVSLVSFVGIFFLIKRVSKSIFITAFVSFAAGSLIGDVFFHLLPEHIELHGYTNESVLGILFGITIMLIIEAYLHCSHDSSTEIEVIEKEHDHNHHLHNHLGKLNIIGDGIHNFLDGVAIASSFLISPEIGIATTIAVIFHEIPQEIADVSVLVYSGWNKARILVINFLTALTAMLGVVLVFVLTNFIEDLEKYLVPVAAGQFIYIALADLLPVIHRKAGVKKYIVEIAAFIIGLIIMFLLQSFEAE